MWNFPFISTQIALEDALPFIDQKDMGIDGFLSLYQLCWILLVELSLMAFGKPQEPSWFVSYPCLKKKDLTSGKTPYGDNVAPLP